MGEYITGETDLENFKVQLDYEHTDFDEEVDFGDDARDSEDVFLTRFQISY